MTLSIFDRHAPLSTTAFMFTWYPSDLSSPHPPIRLILNSHTIPPTNANQCVSARHSWSTLEQIRWRATSFGGGSAESGQASNEVVPMLCVSSSKFSLRKMRHQNMRGVEVNYATCSRRGRW
ncbi:hypothetical protein GALMADRAFT_932867 [Galerina marginata CBS 339.88]|uniref:Uncharacterized protein n=1 Tax=Galerina marginata (strain CBS 339.88) TaxID=685588 RepID=A0A067SMW5_GALM3|nr:hypothetical protein GALMADRAFT_932867 [Galerina marginata CBS 339.88]